MQYAYYLQEILLALMYHFLQTFQPIAIKFIGILDQTSLSES